MRSRNTLAVVAIVCFIGLLLVSYTRPMAAQGPDRKLLIAIGQEPTTLDQSLLSTGSDYMIAENYGEYLIEKTPSGDLRPGLVTSWKVSSDGKEIEFSLRKGVKFHNGDGLTAKDVEFSFERGRLKNPVVKSRLGLIQKFTVIDDYRFKIDLKMPDVTLIPNRVGTAIVSKSYFDRVGEDKFTKNPVGTGPYKFVRHAPGEYVDIERFEEYWGAKPSVREARFIFASEDTTRVAKLRAGEVDLISSCPYPLVKEITRSPGLKIVKLATLHPSPSVSFNTQNPNTPWYDKRVRRAMAYAIDWKSIVENVLQGIPEHWAFLASHEVGYDPDLKPYPYDPKKARELLAEAGYPKGFEFKFYWPVTGRFPMSREMSEAIASYLEAVGIRTKLVGEEWAAYQSRRDASKGPEVEFVALIGAGLSGAPDPTYNFDLFFSKGGRFSTYSNPEVNKLGAEAKAIVDDAKRGEAIKKVVRIIYDDVAVIPIYNTVAIFAMKENIDFNPTKKHNMELILVKDVTLKK
jgi:peptide/nickel transport system substrate-binding protein